MDPIELEQIVRRYGDSIYRLALQYTRVPADAEDVLQEVLLERCSRRQPFQSEEQIGRAHV